MVVLPIPSNAAARTLSPRASDSAFLTSLSLVSVKGRTPSFLLSWSRYLSVLSPRRARPLVRPRDFIFPLLIRLKCQTPLLTAPGLTPAWWISKLLTTIGQNIYSFVLRMLQQKSTTSKQFLLHFPAPNTS